MDERHNSYKDMLLDVSLRIDKDDLQRMKFKCDQVIKKRQNEKISQPTELFTALEERGFLSETNLDYVKGLLKTCCGGKIDAIRALENYERIYIPGFVPTVTGPQTTNTTYRPGKCSLRTRYFPGSRTTDCLC
uniref:FADD n=1 Tax=Ruditapes philippinarum TaxID=129788 RepID=A0A411H949_RUDPH|nr:FADD [Ruditapes philippinarum]